MNVHGYLLTHATNLSVVASQPECASSIQRLPSVQGAVNATLSLVFDRPRKDDHWPGKTTSHRRLRPEAATKDFNTN